MAYDRLFGPLIKAPRIAALLGEERGQSGRLPFFVSQPPASDRGSCNYAFVHALLVRKNSANRCAAPEI